MNGTNWADFGVCVAIACVFIAGFYAAFEFVRTGHPWFGLLMLLIVGSIRVKTGG